MNALTLVHNAIKAYVGEGGVCIDATAGRGYDTAFLCELVGKDGSVTAFDVQQDAIDSTKNLLESKGLCARLVLDSHANMAKYFEDESVDCIVFNLGYLPKGDHSVYTHFESTKAAIEAGLKILKRGGLMTVSAAMRKRTLCFRGSKRWTTKNIRCLPHFFTTGRKIRPSRFLL